MEQSATKQQTRSISQTSELELPVTLASSTSEPQAIAMPMPSPGAGAFGALVERHYVGVGLTGMLLAGLIFSVPAFAEMTVRLGPVFAMLSWMAGHELEKRDRLSEADVAGCLALVGLGATVLAAVFAH